MMTRGAAWLLALVALPAAADITLSGSQHIGDGENASFTPRDPVERAQMQANPTNFWLSQDTTITAIRLDGVVDLDGRLQVFIDDMNTPLPGVLGGNTYTLASPLTLAAGAHAIWPDGGCSGGGFAMPCAAGDNDFHFDSITLVSAQTTLSRNFNQRRHVGDTDDPDNDYAGQYPDRAEGTAVTFGFTLETSRVLTQARFYRLRGIAASPASLATVKIDAGTAAEVQIGSLAANGAVQTLDTGLTLAAGAHTITITTGVGSGAPDGGRDDLSWDDLVLVFIPLGAGVAGQFNAVDAAAGDVLAGPLTTKTAGASFTVDIVALAGGVPVGTYAGTVSVELVDASNAAGSCTSWNAVANLGSLTFSAVDGGRKSLTTTYANALANGRIRVTDSANAVTSCSTDNFAIRPAAFGGITVSHDDPQTPGTAAALATGGFDPNMPVVHKAGRYFTVQAYARSSTGAVTTAYAGSPELRATAAVAGMGAIVGNASATSWTYPPGAPGYLRTDAAQYDEVGAVTLELVDTTFAAVDADDTDIVFRQVGPTSFSVGRFIPDHLSFVEVGPVEFAPGCGSFTYIGQAFTFASGAQARVTAMAAGGTPTRNYTDPGLYKLGVGPLSTYAVTAGTFDATVIPNPDNTVSNEGNGRTLLTLLTPPGGYRFLRAAPQPAFAAEITISPAFTEGDGVAFATATPGHFGDAIGGIPFSAGSNELRFGRLVVGNAQGSELLPLDVPLQTEYLLPNGSGFARNLADGCSLLASGNVTLSGNLAGPPDPPGNTSIVSITGAAGLWNLRLAAPGDPGSVQITAEIDPGFAWLLTDVDGDGYDDEPQGLATFGLASGNTRRIFQREVIGY